VDWVGDQLKKAEVMSCEVTSKVSICPPLEGRAHTEGETSRSSQTFWTCIPSTKVPGSPALEHGFRNPVPSRGPCSAWDGGGVWDLGHGDTGHPYSCQITHLFTGPWPLGTLRVRGNGGDGGGQHRAAPKRRGERKD
jgi:hypothetical protein